MTQHEENKYKQGTPQRRRDGKARKALERMRLQAVKRVLAGESPSQIAHDINIHRSRVYKWLDVYKKQGKQGLKSKPITGRPKQKGKKRKAPKRFSEQETTALQELSLESWILILYQSLLDLENPLGSFFTHLNRYMGGGAGIIPDLKTPSSFMRRSYEKATLSQIIESQQTARATWLTNPFLRLLKKPGDLFTSEDIIPQSAWKESDFFHQLLEPRGVDQAIALCFAGPDRVLSGLFVHRLSNKPFSAKERELLLNLQPHLETALKLAVSHWRNTFTVKALKETTDHMEIVAFVLDGNGYVIDYSAGAEERLAGRSSLSMETDQIQFTSQHHQKQFDQALKKAIAWRQEPLGEKPIIAMRLEDQEGGWLGVLVQPIVPPSLVVPHSVTSCPHVIVYINDPAKSRSLPQHHLIAQLFNLSGREAYLVSLLVNGHTLQQTADMMGVTLTTVRTYLQHIYEKTGVNRRQDLIRRVTSSVALLA